MHYCHPLPITQFCEMVPTKLLALIALVAMTMAKPITHERAGKGRGGKLDYLLLLDDDEFTRACNRYRPIDKGGNKLKVGATLPKTKG